MGLKFRSLRGPTSYATGGVNITLGDYEYISAGSGAIGRKVSIQSVSSSQFFPLIASHSGNIATVLVQDGRSGMMELANAEDLSAMDWSILYEGY